MTGSYAALTNLMQVNILLREGDGDSFFVEALLDGLLEVVEHAPIILFFAPGADIEVHATAGELGHLYLRLGIVEDALVSLEHVENDLLNLVEVLGVTNSKAHIDPAGVVGGNIGDGAT